MVIEGASPEHAKIEFIPYKEYIEGEWRNAITVFNSKNISIENIGIKHTYGDGIYVGDNNLKKGCIVPDYSEKIKIQNCIIEEASRNGISANSVIDFQVLKCRIMNTRPINPCVARKGPWGGIDLEPDNKKHRLEHIRIKSCTFTDNKQDAILIVCRHMENNPLHVVVENSKIQSSGRFGILIIGINPNIGGSALFKKGYITNTGAAAICAIDKAKAGAMLDFTDLWISKNCLDANTNLDYSAPLLAYKKENVHYRDGNIKFTHIKVKDNLKKHVFRAKGLDETDKISGVSGDLWLDNKANGGLWLELAEDISLNVHS